VVPHLEQAGLVEAPLGPQQRAYIERVVEVTGDRLKVGNQIAELAGFFFKDEIEYDQTAAEKFMTRHYVGPAFRVAEDRLAELETFDVRSVETAMRALAQEMGLKAGELFQPVRVALTGTRQSPGLFEVMVVLGRDRVLERLRRARRAYS
jgi:glutamyl-tRNA synthetase